MNSWVSALLVLEKTLLQSYRSLSNFAPRQIFSLNILDKLYLSSRKVWSFASTFNPRCLTCYISQDTSWDPTYFYCYCSNQEKHKNFARINYGRHGILIFSCLLFDLFEKICSIKSCNFSNHGILIGKTKPDGFLIFPLQNKNKITMAVFGFVCPFRLCIICNPYKPLWFAQKQLEHDPF